jgi:Domain of unknown function (DUF3372)
MRPLLADPSLRAGCSAMSWTAFRFRQLLAIRGSSPLFTLGSVAEIQDKLSFPTSGPGETPGVLTMHVSDKVGGDVDPALESVTVVFNGSDTTQRQTVEGLRGAAVTLHPAQAGADDPRVRASTFDPATGTFMVPARTVAVFVEPVG